MKCPACPTISLVMTDRSGIEIDYCPDCRGVWLDHAELDKIIERATVLPAASQAQPTPSPPADSPVPAHWPVRRDRYNDDDDDRPRYQEEYVTDSRPVGKRRKKSLLGDLFDF